MSYATGECDGTCEEQGRAYVPDDRTYARERLDECAQTGHFGPTQLRTAEDSRLLTIWALGGRA